MSNNTAKTNQHLQDVSEVSIRPMIEKGIKETNNSKTSTSRAAAGETETRTMNHQFVLDAYQYAADPFTVMRKRTGRNCQTISRMKFNTAMELAVGKENAESIFKVAVSDQENATRYMFSALCKRSLRRGHGFESLDDLKMWNNFHWTAQDVIDLVSDMKSILHHQSQMFIGIQESTEPGVLKEILFEDDARRFLIKEDGIYEGERGRRINNALLVHSKGNDKSEIDLDVIKAEDLVLLNSHGVFGTWLMNYGASLLSGRMKEAGKLFDQYLTDGNIPIMSLEDVGAPDQDRRRYEEYSTKVLFIKPGAEFFPFILEEQSGRTVIKAQSDLKELDFAYVPQKYALDSLILEEFNLANYKGDYIDGRLTCIRAKDIPEAYRAKWLDTIAEELGYDRSSLGEDTVITLSSKIAKAIKRCMMDSAQVGAAINGEGRGLKLYGQKEQSQYNVMIPSVISQTLIAGAGVAVYFGDNPPTLRNPHCSRRQLAVQPIFDENGPKIEFVVEPAEVLKENGWYVAKFEKDTIQVREGTEIAKVPYQTKDGMEYISITSDIDLEYLDKLSWRMIRQAGGQESMVVKLDTVTLESTNKVRNNVKAMLTPGPKSYIHNGLNPGIEADALFPRDTNKWSDLVKGNLDVAAATFIKNKEHELCQNGYRLVLEANQGIGSSATNYLEYSPVMAVAGYYKPILEEFEFVFGQPIWQKVNCDQAGDWAKHLRNQYITEEGQPVNGWQHITEDSKVLSNIPKGATVNLAISQGSSENEKNNVLISYTTAKGASVVLQRGWSYAGPQGCPVFQPVKLEVASVATAVSKGRTMAGVARSIFKDNPEVGMAILKDGQKAIHNAAITVALSKGLDIKDLNGNVLPSVHILKNGRPTAEGLALLTKAGESIKNPSNKASVLNTLTQEFKNVVLKFDHPKHGQFGIWLPAINKDADSDFRNAFSLGALVSDSLGAMALGYEENKAQIELSLGRISKALKGMAESDGIVKSCAFGKAGVYSKPVALAEIPIHQVWVKESDNKRSVGQMLSSINKLSMKKVDGMQVALSRAPMVQAAYLEVKVIGENHWAHKFMSDCVSYLNPITCAIHGGDQDGDTNFLVSTAIKGNRNPMEYLSLERVYNLVTERTGSDQLADSKTLTYGSVYYSDHNEIKSLEAINKKAGLQKANVSTTTQFGGMIERSTQTLTEAVGALHSVALHIDLYQSLVHETKELLGFTPGNWQSDALNAVLYEAYEIPLAGLDESLYKLLYGENGLLKEDSKYSEETLKNLKEYASEAGMNSEYLESIIKSVRMAEGCNKLSSGKFGDIEQKVEDKLMLFNMVATELSVKISKGKLNPKTKGFDQMMGTFFETLKGLTEEQRTKLIDNSPVLWPLSQYRKHIMSAQLGYSPKVDVQAIAKDINTNEPVSLGTDSIDAFLKNAEPKIAHLIEAMSYVGRTTEDSSGESFESKFFKWTLTSDTNEVKIYRKDAEGSQVTVENISGEELLMVQAMVNHVESMLYNSSGKLKEAESEVQEGLETLKTIVSVK